jgi:rod shape determining protein RodA
MKLDRRLITNFDWPLLGLALVIAFLGIMTIYSATRPLSGGDHPTYYIKQIYWLLISIAAMAAVVSVDYKWFELNSSKLLWASIALLLVVLVAGRIGMGAKRWISMGPMNLQPSEVYKLVLIAVMARYLSRFSGALDHRSVFKAFFAYVLFPVLLIMKQPDLGTSLVILALFVSLILTKGVGRKMFTMAVLISMVTVPFMGSIVWDELKPYQKKRIVAFVNPDADPAGTSYQVQQSKVAVGSGGAFGKGYLKGTQGPFRFLPEKHTDFLFSVFAEEWGFLGSLTLLLLYLGLILRGIDTALKAKDEFGRLLALGVTYMFMIYCFINIGMTLGLVPIVGVPLPLMSYGGTALMTNFMGIGLLISIRARRFELFY